jgi:serine/threonine-protein kinase
MRCPRCSKLTGPSERFCSGCGASLEETLIAEAPAQPSSGPSSGSSSYSVSSAAWLAPSSADAGFAPGTMLLGRYRIVGLLGRGGMGEVYRADDLVLGQSVALKFLPHDLAQNPDRLNRFRNEVRIARQVSHPNVCRVYDIGDLAGRPFLSMELVDGEDLASLLRRIGRLPKDKAVDLGRQICAGLAAAHAAGVLHRDLKPANIMVDGRGKARMTDFGLAVLADRPDGGGRAGTPAYMSPEQLEGGELTVQSDLYSLGLVLYEVLTGQRPFHAKSLEDLAREHSTPLTSPSSLIDEIDPVLERAILRCLAFDPRERPKSALAVAASLPGGDPLAAALEAGETPSPEMVAAAGQEGRLRPMVAWSCLAAIALVITIILLGSGKYMLANRIPPGKPPAVLFERANVIVARFAYDTKPEDAAHAFTWNQSYVGHIASTDRSVHRWDRLATDRAWSLLYWYRQSPAHLLPLGFGSWAPDFDDPPPALPGMLRLQLDAQGNLMAFAAVPPLKDALVDSLPAVDDATLFELTGLEPARFTSVAPEWLPRDYCDERRAWTGSAREAPDTPLRLEVGLLRGRPVSLEVIGPWVRPDTLESQDRSLLEKIGTLVSTLLVMALLVGSAVKARDNLLHGRGDRRGATRLAFFIFALLFLGWLLNANHAASLPREWSQFMPALALMVFLASLFWVVYIALEPYMRRQWPALIISWTRLLAGRWRDPLVGRDLLIGTLLGTLFVLLDMSEHFVPAWLGLEPRIPERTVMFDEAGAFAGIKNAILIVANQLFGPLALTFLLLGLRQLFHSKWVAAIVLAVVFGTLVAGAEPYKHPVVSAIVGLVFGACTVLVILRFGVLAFVVSNAVYSLIESFPLTPEWSRWYAEGASVVLVLVAALGVSGLWAAVGGRAGAHPMPRRG